MRATPHPCWAGLPAAFVAPDYQGAWTAVSSSGKLLLDLVLVPDVLFRYDLNESSGAKNGSCWVGSSR